MAKLTIAGKALVVTSSMKLEDLMTIKKYQPAALTLMGGEDNKEPIFVVDVSNDGKGSISSYGVHFGDATRDDSKNACITVMLDNVQGDIKEYVADKYGEAYGHLSTLEAQLPGILTAVREKKAAMIAAITTM